MLVVIRTDGKRISLGEKWEKVDLIGIRSKERLYCPECGEQVVMKLGNKKIWHFSHRAGGSCQYAYDRESEYHLSGKLKLYFWLKKQGVHVELESYDPIMKQKPDIAFEWNKQKYAIEYQCSVISAEIFEKRTKTYFEHGVIPIWIAAENMIKRKSNQVVSMNNFLYLFIRQPRSSWNLSAFCPVTEQFINMHGTIPITSKKTITKFEVQSLNHYTVEELLCPGEKPFAFLRTWQNENQKFKSSYLTSPGAWHNPFLKELYSNHLSLLTIPSEMGLPVHSSPYIETPSIIWQTYLYLDVFRHFRIGDIIYYSRIKEAFIKRIRRKEIKLRTLPAAGQRDHWHALAEYVFLLTRVSFLEKIDSGKVKVLRKIIIPDSIVDQAKAEADFYTKYENEIRESIFP